MGRGPPDSGKPGNGARSRVERLEEAGTNFFFSFPGLVYFSRGTLPSKTGKRALGDLGGVSHFGLAEAGVTGFPLQS